jgi:type IV secretory pathway TrbD component
MSWITQEGRMAKKSNQKKRQQDKEKKPVPVTNEPWLSQRTGRIIMIIGSLALVIFMTYQLAPALGLGEALLWGFGFGVAIWGVFFLSYAFNRWVRRRKGDNL